MLDIFRVHFLIVQLHREEKTWMEKSGISVNFSQMELLKVNETTSQITGIGEPLKQLSQIQN